MTLWKATGVSIYLTKILIMKTWKLFALAGLVACCAMLLAFTSRESHVKKPLRPYPKGCVFRTVMGEESSDSMFIFKTPARVNASIDRALSWIVRAQSNSGGWGAGSHARQDIMDPHAVDADPATTAMVSMALLRSGSTLNSGPYKAQLNQALMYLLEAVESAPAQSYNITSLTGTQIQSKLGQNIDVVLTSQFLSNLMETLNQGNLRERVKKANAICVTKIQQAVGTNGAIAGSGWAGVLQSSFATTALESAQANDVRVDERALARSKEFQKNNYNPRSGEVATDMGAGVVLYSVSGSSRASAQEARKVSEEMDKARKEGRLEKNAPATPENLQKIGFDSDDARRYSTAYEVYQSAKVQAQRSDVMEGYGNAGGEEFLSYLQTGEGMIIGKDAGWQKWYDNISGRMLSIQNQDGSWNGHHCITSPVFCTATSLLILSVGNDVDKLVSLGATR
jgi:hypothetical protein